jgi:hypothetical protein
MTEGKDKKTFKETLVDVLVPALITVSLTVPTTILSVNYSTDKNFKSWVEQNKIQYETQLQQEVLTKRLELIEELSNLFDQRLLAEVDAQHFFEAYTKNVIDSFKDRPSDIGKLIEQKLYETIQEDKDKYKLLDEWNRKWSQLETKSNLYFGESTRIAFHEYWAAGGHWYDLESSKNKASLFQNIVNAMRDELDTSLPEHFIIEEEESK